MTRRQLLQSLAGLPFLGVLKPSDPLDRTVEAKATPKTPKGETSGFVQHAEVQNKFWSADVPCSGILTKDMLDDWVNNIRKAPY